MIRKYASVLRRFPPYAKAAAEICSGEQTPHLLLTAYATAPVLFTYVWYVLGQAERMGLKRLYFISESGNAMLEIAREIAKICPVSLELRYLYCSDASLRLPALHRMEIEEALIELFRLPQARTLQQLLDRAAFTPEQRAALRTELVLPKDTEELSPAGYLEVCTSLRSSVKFRKIIIENSVAAHSDVLGYLTQMGLTDGTSSGIVYAGWCCAIQRYLRQLSEDIHPTGFYFALRTRPKAAADGVYHTWYFSADDDIGLRTRFSWFLMQIICMPPHGTLLTYVQDAHGHYLPVLSEPSPNAETIQMQINICKQFAALCAAEISYSEFPLEEMKQLTKRLLTGLMFRPTEKEASVFCDLIQCGKALIQQNDEASLRKLRRPPAGFLWSYGTLAISHLHLKALRRLLIQKQEAAVCLMDKIKSL